MIKFFKVTLFIETGTYLGATSVNMANLYPRLPIFTCEVNKKFHRIIKQDLKEYKNVRIENIISEIFFAKLFKNKGKLGELFNFPLIFLDAYWYDFWPFQSEIKIISSRLNKIIIIIDDFEVPNKPEYNYYTYERSINPKPFNISLIEKELDNKKKYSLLYPKYNIEDAKISKLVEYIIIFQNLSDLSNKFINNEFVQNNFFEYIIRSIY